MLKSLKMIRPQFLKQRFSIRCIFPNLPAFSLFFSSSVSSSGADGAFVGVKVLLEELSLITILGHFLEKTVFIG